MKYRQISTKELKEKELEILSFFHEYCAENNLSYYLAAGTLLGAVRHKGFIPWDDDIDVYMIRDDYMRLISIFPKKGINGLKLLTPFTDKHCPITYGKLYDTFSLKFDNEVEKKYQKYGVDIDIFPLDYVPDNISDMNRFYQNQYFSLKVFLGIVGKYRKEKTVIKTICKAIFMTVCKFLALVHILNANKIAIKINESAMRFGKGEYLCSSMLPRGRKARPYAKTQAFQKRLLAIFEGKEFYIPSGYEEYLTNTYGNYMQLPPIDQQVTHHLSNVYIEN